MSDEIFRPAADQVESSTILWREGAQTSKRLLIINKGPGAVDIPREGQSWDLLEIYFAKKDIEAAKSDPAFTQADHVVFENDRNMRKFAIIRRIFERHDIFRKYDVVMMLDDDLIPVGCSIADIFDAFERSGFRVGQPALSPDSYWSHEVVLQNKRFRWRKTNFVEVMCPIMNAEAMREYLPLFDATISGFGLDVYWSTQEWTKHGGLVILDATPMRHTRPVRGGVAYQGLSPGEERLAFFEQHRLRNFRHLTLGGESLTTGKLISNIRVSHRSQLRDMVKFAFQRFWQRLGFCLLFGLCFVMALGKGELRTGKCLKGPESKSTTER